jgi:dihydrofolate synthase / folylpolyglutamate synthase
MDLKETLDYIYSFVNYEISPAEAYNRRYYNIKRVEELLARVGNPHLIPRSVHVAGTKGKGSTTFMIARVLTECGYRTGLFTKPHLIDLRERWQINNELITETELIDFTERLRPEIEAINSMAHYGRLTTFEIIVAIGFLFYAGHKCDFQVLEVGLGGTLDATNVITPEVSVITPISYDHVEVLGKTLTEIASAKAGIIKPGVPVVSSIQRAEAMEVIRDACRQQNAPLIRVGPDITCEQRGFRGGMQLFHVRGRSGCYDIETPLLGYYQVDNVPTAVGALEVLMERGYQVTSRDIVNGLARVSWPGRFQIIDRAPTILIDGAHNEDSATRLREAIEKYFTRDGSGGNRSERYRKAILIIGTSSDHDADAIVGELYPLFDKVIITCSRHPRAARQEAISALLQKYGITAEETANVTEAVQRARALAAPDDLIVATGSLFVVGEMLEVVKGWKVAV